MRDIPVVDAHVHFPSGFRSGAPRSPRDEFSREQYRWMLRAWDFPPPEAEHPGDEVIVERWVAEVARHGLERVLFVTHRDNRALEAVVAGHRDIFAGLAHHSLDAPDALEELQRAVEEGGLKGYKTFGPRVQHPFEDPRYRKIWTYMADHKLPLLIHFGILGGGGGVSHHPRISPLSIHDVAREFMDMPIVVPHFGAGYWQELLHLGWSTPNVIVDTSGSNQWVRWMPYPLDIDQLIRKAYETFGPERMIFGTDSSWFPRGFALRYLEDQIRACQLIRMPESDQRKFFADNAKRIYRL